MMNTNGAFCAVMGIRFATLHDVWDIFKIQIAVYDEVYWEREDVLARIVSCGCSFVHIAEGKVVGYMLCHPFPIDNIESLRLDTTTCVGEWNTWFLIHDLAVLPKHRRMGMASKLVVHGAEYLKTIGVRGLHLVSVNDTNNWWRRFGFCKSGTDCKLIPNGVHMAVLMTMFDDYCKNRRRSKEI